MKSWCLRSIHSLDIRKQRTSHLKTEFRVHDMISEFWALVLRPKCRRGSWTRDLGTRWHRHTLGTVRVMVLFRGIDSEEWHSFCSCPLMDFWGGVTGYVGGSDGVWGYRICCLRGSITIATNVVVVFQRTSDLLTWVCFWSRWYGTGWVVEDRVDVHLHKRMVSVSDLKLYPPTLWSTCL